MEVVEESLKNRTAALNVYEYEVAVMGDFEVPKAGIS